MVFRIDRTLFHSASVVSGELTPWDFLNNENNNSDLTLALASVLWPDLIEIDGFVFFAENYDEDYYKKTMERVGASSIEETINLNYLPHIFGRISNTDEVWVTVGKIVCESWKAKAEAEFPDRRFATRFDWHTEIDPVVTLFSIRPETSQGV